MLENRLIPSCVASRTEISAQHAHAVTLQRLASSDVVLGAQKELLLAPFSREHEAKHVMKNHTKATVVANDS